MKMFVYLIDLKDGVAEKYIERHAHIEPAVPAMLEKLHVRQNRICRLGNHLINIMILDDDTPDDVLKEYTADPACRTWDEEMSLLQKKLPEAQENEWWAQTETVFLFDQIGIK